MATPAPLVEWAFQTVVSTPNFFRLCLVMLPMEFALRGKNGGPLKDNSIGSITKQSLQKLGVDTTVWKAHSTRGAGVAMYKSLGFTSEEVCELGKWKNVSAFSESLFEIECNKQS